LVAAHVQDPGGVAVIGDDFNPPARADALLAGAEPTATERYALADLVKFGAVEGRHPAAMTADCLSRNQARAVLARQVPNTEMKP
jgi:hypothetical protein